MAKVKTRLVRASITAAEHDGLRVAAIRAGVPVQDYAAEALRIGMKALRGKGRT